jgi:hypothetical protein
MNFLMNSALLRKISLCVESCDCGFMYNVL